MENTGSTEIANAFTKAGEILSRNLSDELKRDFGIWIRRTFRTNDKDIDFAKLTDKEIRPMLEKTIENFGNTRYNEGKQEGILEAAKKMLTHGIELNKISEVTGISVKELKKLLN